MKRWNGWGDEKVDYPLPDSAARYLAELVGQGRHAGDATLEQVLQAVPPASIPAHPLISTQPEERLRHARGQSLPDWIALRSGQIRAFPDGVVYPASEQELRSLLEYARQTGVKLIPYGGGTSVVGHINPLPGEAPILSMDLSRLNRLLSLDETSQLATFEAGISGPEIEKQLAARGYTLGHFPQSFEQSTLGGWIATRSSGQQSYHYGRIEALFAGGHLETPIGSLDLPVHPASAAGPDLKQLVLGSEGRLGVVTRATLRVRRLPESEAFYGVFFHDWDAGAAAVRAIAQAGVGVSMLRMSNAMETATTLALSGQAALVKWAGRGLSVVGYGEARGLLVFGVTGTHRQARQARLEALEIIRSYGGLMTGAAIGRMWQKSRFYTPYLRNTLWDDGYALDTLETALPWSEVKATAEETQKVLLEGLAEQGERVLVFAHLSHVYRDGASIYITYLYRHAADPDETLRRWQVLKAAASRVIQRHGGTISHQHGVGLDHAAYLAAEKGPLGMQALGSAIRLFDPDGLMNPGKLLEI
ncbi:MAG TPA: FAD-binding oxidoreductase [Anaerolineales bacterium]|nr:FAD-binding oxidoreductase [Anaerolineales bacterium]